MYENPSYALLDIDAETMLPVNWRIFSMDLEQANATGTPEWVELIDYSKDYLSGEGVSPDGLNGMAERLLTDSEFYWQINYDKTRHVGDKKIGTDAEWQKLATKDFCQYTSSNH